MVGGGIDVPCLPVVSVAKCHHEQRATRHVQQQLLVERELVYGVSACVTVGVLPIHTFADCIRAYLSYGVSACVTVGVLPIHTFADCIRAYLSYGVLQAHCENVNTKPLQFLANCQRTTLATAVLCHGCVDGKILPVGYVVSCLSAMIQPVVLQNGCVRAWQSSWLELSQCVHSRVKVAVPVPCRFYPIEEEKKEEEEEKKLTCKPRPKFLPFGLTRKNEGGFLPFPFVCWHDNVVIVPNLRSYIVHNTVTATFNGVEIDILNFNIQTDINSYCWQGSVGISSQDFAKVKVDGEIRVVINGVAFVIMAESYSKQRQFANESYDVGGRSVTAKLGADYAQSQSGLLDQDNYASQIVNQQLENLPFVCDFGVADWFVPAQRYAVSGKTPIAVIHEIASACGGFLMSDKAQAKLYIRPKWKKSAWELSSASPDRVVGLDAIKRISEQKRVNTRYNTVTLVGSEGGIVYRQRENREYDAGVVDNVLYTDRACIVPAGLAVLSNSGVHTDYTLEIRWAEKYQLPLAELGEIWQVNDVDGAWRGVVVSVAVSVQMENDVPVVWQTVGLDRYLDV